MKLHTFTALPTTPPKLQPLLEIAQNMWISWNWDAIQLFVKLDEKIWKLAHKNPLRMLCDIPQKRLEEMAENEDYVAEVQAVYSSFKKYLSEKTWYQEKYGEYSANPFAYFSCEFGIHESLPIYSGGLGVLAGDHLKSASDLGVPLVAVGILYREGYFRQALNADGIQLELYPENDRFSMPVHLEKDKEGNPILLSMDLGGDEVFYQIWKVMVGRISLYLLDTNLHCNKPKHRDITKRLYDADRDVRLRQEILLGMGGVKALRTLDIEPSIYHINEGHSAFLILERLRHLMEEKMLTFEEAKEMIWATSIFTTHTPVPAGNERFDINAIKKYLGIFVQKRLSLNWNDFLSLGREDPTNEEEEFCLTVLALKFSAHANGVAKLHGVVSRNMWQSIYPEVPCDEVPIGHVTNGVHSRTWLSKHFEQLLARYMQTSLVPEVADFTLWKNVNDIPNLELWHAHLERKKELVQYVRKRVDFQLRRRGASASEITRSQSILDPNALTIGFARRFAPYKRGTLIFHDQERLDKIINDADRPVQFLFAGKAHPADMPGKELIKSIAAISKKSKFNNRVVFLEDYDIDMARFLVQGVDVWLNNPKRPMEASGTSGMKAAMNGAPNLSILDGWWDEAFDGSNGWAIGHTESYDDPNYQNEVEANLLYRLLEDEVIPLYYERDEMNVPAEWVAMMKSAIKSAGEDFNAHRMVSDYIEKYYRKAEELYERLSKDDYKKAKDLAQWQKSMAESWKELEIVEVETPDEEVIYSGTEVHIHASVKLGKIQPEHVSVEVYHGRIDNEEHITVPERTQMDLKSKTGDITLFTTKIPCDQGGRYGYTIRVLPGHPDLAEVFVPKLIKWSD